MKSYTDLKQSEKLAEILPIESADMGWDVFVDNSVRCLPMNDWDLHKDGSNGVKFIPCWSLAALIELLPLGVDIHNITDGHKMYYYVELYTKEIYMKLKRINKPEICLSSERHENLVDACYEMILKLHEQNLL